jgi:hypothetical protein
MSEQIGRYRCPTCGAIFLDEGAFLTHTRAHGGAELQPAYETKTDSREDLTRAYSHADSMFKRARLPIFGIAVAFLLTFAYATVLGIGLFAPMFMGATIAVIIGAAFLFRELMEG